MWSQFLVPAGSPSVCVSSLSSSAGVVAAAEAAAAAVAALAAAAAAWQQACCCSASCCSAASWRRACSSCFLAARTSCLSAALAHNSVLLNEDKNRQRPSDHLIGRLTGRPGRLTSGPDCAHRATRSVEALACARTNVYRTLLQYFSRSPAHTHRKFEARAMARVFFFFFFG